jgi:hypothetical protein
MKVSARLLKAGKQLWKEARSKFPGDDVAARAWFNEHIVHRIDWTADNEKAAEDALVERVRTICVDAARMYPDREAAMKWVLDTWERDVGSVGNRNDPEVWDVIRKCLDLAYSGKLGEKTD